MRKLARQISFLLIYSSDMGESNYKDVLQHYLEEDNLEDFLVAANIISVFPELDEDTLDSVLAEDDKNFIIETVSGTMENKVDIDNLINAQAKNWSTLRMASADKNILRMGIYELVFSKDKIDAAVDLARLYGDEESYKFVNAILDAIYKKEINHE